MDEKQFIDSYLKPSADELNRDFVFPLPSIADLNERGKFIVQGELEDTFSTNIIFKYEGEDSNIKLIDVYKCSQNIKTGVFVRLFGTMSMVKPGYPFLFLDAAVTNISPLTQEREDTTTRVLIHIPQATDEQREIVFSGLSEIAKQRDIPSKEMIRPNLPMFWGPVWMTESKKFDKELIEDLRNIAATTYVSFTSVTKEDETLHYMSVKNHMIFKASKSEHALFGKMGLTVPAEAQAAFFSILSSGVEDPS